MSTSEPTTTEGATRDSTKSISDPAVFITALTRARSLVVAAGNPFMLLRREEHMVRKYRDRGHCWSLFLKACIDNGTLSVYQDCDDRPETLALLKKMTNDRVLHLCVPEPNKAAGKSNHDFCDNDMSSFFSDVETATPSVNVVPSTPTEVCMRNIYMLAEHFWRAGATQLMCRC